jgi:hypothetical protein
VNPRDGAGHAGNCRFAAVARLSSISSGVVSGGDQWTTGQWPGIEQRTPGSRPGLRAAVYARLEEISFRAGIAAATTLLALVGVALAIVVTLLPGHTALVTSAAGKPAAMPAVKASPAAAATPTAVPSPRSSAPRLAAASSPPLAAAGVTQPTAQATQPVAAPASAGQRSSGWNRFAGGHGHGHGHGGSGHGGSGGYGPRRPGTGRPT